MREPFEILRRAMLLKHVVVRALAFPPPERMNTIFDRSGSVERVNFLNRWREQVTSHVALLTDCGLWQNASDEDRVFLMAMPTKVTAERINHAMWRMEEAGCLLWSLGVVEEIPAYDTTFSTEHLKRLPSTPRSETVFEVSLRDMAQINHAREVAELWNCRNWLREMQLTSNTHVPSGKVTLSEAVAIVAHRAVALGAIKTVKKGDLPVFGKVFGELKQSESWHAAAIAVERYHALSWICGITPQDQWGFAEADA